MAATTMPPPVDTHDDPDAHGGRIRLYVIVAIALALMTAAEVSTYYLPDLYGGKGSAIATGVLLFLMAVKFWTVAWFFMHLKWDKRFLTTILYFGLGLAFAVYMAILLVFRFFGPPESHQVSH